MRIKDLGQIWLLFLDELLEFGNFANLFECKHFIFFVPVDGKTSRVLEEVSSVWRCRA